MANTAPIPLYDIAPYQKGYAIKTITTINTTEITQVLNKGMQLLADLGIAAGYASLYHQQDKNQCLRLQLYLYLYAIQSWDTSNNALNFFNQDQLIILLSKVEQLFYICHVNPPC